MLLQHGSLRVVLGHVHWTALRQYLSVLGLELSEAQIQCAVTPVAVLGPLALQLGWTPLRASPHVCHRLRHLLLAILCVSKRFIGQHELVLIGRFAPAMAVTATRSFRDYALIDVGLRLFDLLLDSCENFHSVVHGDVQADHFRGRQQTTSLVSVEYGCRLVPALVPAIIFINNVALEPIGRSRTVKRPHELVQSLGTLQHICRAL